MGYKNVSFFGNFTRLDNSFQTKEMRKEFTGGVTNTVFSPKELKGSCVRETYCDTSALRVYSRLYDVSPDSFYLFMLRLTDA